MALTELLILEFGASVGETKLIGSQFGVIFFFLSLFFFFFERGGSLWDYRPVPESTILSAYNKAVFLNFAFDFNCSQA